MLLRIVLLLFILLYVVFVPISTKYLDDEHRSVAISFPPSYKIIKAVSLDYQLLVGQYLTVKVLTYFGGRDLEKSSKLTRDEYYIMYRNLETATRLDPYNIDAYYFAQSILSWDVKEIKAANALLDYGMKYRTWDYYLPFFAGFNCSYFLKDHVGAAKYYKKAAELTGNDLFMRLASRNLYDAGKTFEAMTYLEVMIKSTKNEALKHLLNKRYNAFASAHLIELARDQYCKKNGRTPVSIEALLDARLLSSVPNDPYGGTFFIDEKGVVRSTSNFSEGVAKRKNEVEIGGK